MEKRQADKIVGEIQGVLESKIVGEKALKDVYNGAHKLEEIISYFESSNLKI